MGWWYSGIYPSPSCNLHDVSAQEVRGLLTEWAHPKKKCAKVI